MSYSRRRTSRSALWRRAGVRILAAPLATAVLFLAGCSDDPVQPPEHEHSVATISVSPNAVNLSVSEHATLAAETRCGCGGLVNASVSWTTSDASIATVSTTGVVSAVSLGAATITAVSEGQQAYATIQVSPVGTAVGPEGGIVVSTDGNLELVVPAGALATLTDVLVEPVPASMFGGDPLYVSGTGYQVKPDGLQLQLQLQARLRIRYDPAALPVGTFAEQLRIRERDRVQNQWRETAGHQLIGQQVQAQIQQFGVFGIVIEPPVGTMVGPAGGTVTSADGNAELVIPAGALVAPTDIQIEPVPASMFENDPLYVPATGYQLSPDGLQLQERAQLRIRYNPVLLPPGAFAEQLRLRERDRLQNQWQATEQHQLLGQRVHGEMHRLGIYAVVVQPAVGMMIGPAGGLVVSSDGNAEVTIPAGALLVPTDIVVEPFDSDLLTGDPLFIPGTAYQLEPDGLQLQERAQVRIRYNPLLLPAGIFAEQLRLRERDRDQDRWRDTEHHQLLNQVVQGEILRFGTFGLVIQPPVGTMIGPLGGLVMSADGNARLEIPPGALQSPVDVQLEPVADAVFGGDLTFIPGTGYEVRPGGLDLQLRAQLRIRFDPANLSPGVLAEQLRLRERDRLMNQWHDTDQHQLFAQEVRGSISRFGTFAIVVLPGTGTMIGPSGGTVTSTDGNAVLIIPPGALDEVVQFTIEKADETGLPDVALFDIQPDVGGPADVAMVQSPPPTDAFIPGTAYDIRPAGYLLRSQAQLRIQYDPAHLPSGVDPQHLRIRERDRIQNRWRDPALCTTAQDAVTTWISALGLFGIVATTPEDPLQPAVITVSPSISAIQEGDVIQMTAVVLNSAGSVISVPVTWSSSDPTIAVVSPTGLVTAVGVGTVTITATADGVEGQASVNSSKKVASVTVIPATASVIVGGTVQLAAEVRDAQGNLMVRQVTWESSSSAIATVSAGLVTGVSLGNVTITARVQSVSGTASVSVVPPVTTIVIASTANEPLEVGLTRQLTATAYDGSGLPVQVQLTWTSSDNGVASVDQTGLVTGVGRGTATITAAVGPVSDAVDIRVVGESTAELGNNLSIPVVFADGVGITGQPVASDPGVRPLVTDTITVGSLPFFWAGNVPTYGNYYEQQTFNTWRPEIVDGTGQPAYSAQIDWGDNLVSQTWSASRPIRVEQALFAPGLSMVGYNMTLLYGTGATEMQGTDGTTASFTPMIFTAGPTLLIEKLSGQGGSVVDTVVNEVAGSEVNVSGKIIYGYNLKLDTWTPAPGVTKDGWYRLTFRLATGANVNITSLSDVSGTYVPYFSARESSLEIYVKP